VVRRDTAAWLDVAVVARAAEGGEASIAASRAMEGRLRALRATAQPLMGSAIRAPRSARFVHGATAVVLYARHLAPGEALRMLDPPLRGEVAEAGRLVAASARRTAALLAGEEPGAEPSPAASVALRRIRASLRGAAATPHGPATPPVWLGWLERLDEALQDLAAAAEEGRGGGRDARVAGAIADASASRTAPSSA
jgi:hypothetical protein